MLDKRYAALGWLAWQVGKRVARKKARGAVPGLEEGTRRPNRPAIISLLAAIGGVVWIWRRRARDDEPDE